MEKIIDAMLENIFGGLTIQITVINIIVGILFIVGGVHLLTKAKRFTGWMCIAIGSLGILTRLLLLLF